MRIEYDAGVALSIMRANPVRGWTSGKTERMARERLTTGGFLSIDHRAKFAVERPGRSSAWDRASPARSRTS